MPTLHIRNQERREKSSLETSMRILLNDELVAVSQSTPRNIEEMAVGFLLSEKLISERSLLRNIAFNEDLLEVCVYTQEAFSFRDASFKSLTSSGSKNTSLIPDLVDLPAKIISDATFEASDLLSMMDELCTTAPLRKAGQSTHACGIGNKRLLCLREDIGRHNALDKTIGQAWLDNIRLSEMTVCVTGRISYEMALKTIRAGVSTMVSRKGVTDSAIDLANMLGLTIVAFCRDDSMDIYTYPERVL